MIVKSCPKIVLKILILQCFIRTEIKFNDYCMHIKWICVNIHKYLQHEEPVNLNAISTICMSTSKHKFTITYLQIGCDPTDSPYQLTKTSHTSLGSKE